MTTKYTETVFSVKNDYTVMAIQSCRRLSDYTGMEFCANMRRFREAKKWRQEDLAEIIGVAQATVTRWETGQREPKFSDIDRIAEALEVPVADLFRAAPPDPLPSVEELARMIQRARDGIPANATYADFPQFVAADLRAQLVRYRASGGYRGTGGEAIALGTGAPPVQPTTKPDQAGSRNQ